MENIFQSIILGIIQGLGEFLPISSTAHLILAPYFFGWPDPGLAFDVALHVGTLIAVLAYFWQDWVTIILNFKFLILNKKVDSTQSTDRKIMYNKNLLWFLAIATIPGVLAGYFLESEAETIFRSPLLVALTLGGMGLILYLVDKHIQHRKNVAQITLKDSIIIGLSQAIAIIPGISRSGATITAGLALGLDRVSAARFSFLLSTPIIFGAAILKIPHLFREGISIPIIIGILVSAVSGYLAIKYLLRLVEKIGYGIFFWYRLILAFVIVLVYVLS
jgi:undecaprenyl-diphosphatase